MTTTEVPTALPYREVTDRNGRIYRIGESDVDIMGRHRRWMVILPWVGMMGISSAEYAFASAEETLHTAHGWNSAHLLDDGHLGPLPGRRRLPGGQAA